MVPGETGYMGQQACGWERRNGLERRNKELKKMFVETFVERRDSGLYNLKYHIFYHMVEDIHTFGALYA